MSTIKRGSSVSVSLRKPDKLKANIKVRCMMVGKLVPMHQWIVNANDPFTESVMPLASINFLSTCPLSLCVHALWMYTISIRQYKLNCPIVLACANLATHSLYYLHWSMGLLWVVVVYKTSSPVLPLSLIAPIEHTHALCSVFPKWC